MVSASPVLMFLNITFHGKISVRMKTEIIFIFRLHRRPIQLDAFVPLGFSSFLRHLRQVLLGVVIFSVARVGQLTVGVQISDLKAHRNDTSN